MTRRLVMFMMLFAASCLSTPAQTITTGTVSGSPFCPGETITVPFAIAGAFNAGNVFTAQLSNASGSFTAPVAIGTLTGTTSGTITVTIPQNATGGTAYRIRVVSSNPTVTGSNNGIDLTIRTAPISHGGPDQSICRWQSVQIGGFPIGTGPFTYSWSPSSTLSASNIQFPIASPLVTTEYFVVTTDAYGCSATDSITVFVLNPAAVITPPGPITICSGTGVTLTSSSGGGISHRWMRNGVLITGAVGPTYYATLAGTYRVIEAVGLCSDTSNAVVITVLPGPTANAGPNVSLCLGSSVVIGQMATNGTPPYSYSWTPVATLMSPASDTTTATPTTTTQYIVTVTDANGCIGKDTVVVTVYPKPTATISPPGPIAICSGSSVVFSTTSGSGLTYKWTRDGSVITGATGSTYTASLPGSYRAIVTQSICSDTSAAALLTVYPKPTATAGADTSICSGSSAIIGQPSSGGTPPYTYSWTPATGLSSTTSVPTTATPTSTTQYIVTVTDANGCVGKDTVVVTIKPKPAPSITPPGPIFFCYGGSAVLTANSGTGLTYQWSLDGNPIIGANGATYIATTAGTYRVTESLSGCMDSSAAVIVVVNPKPVALAGPDTSICPGSSVSIGQPATGGTAPYSYSWSPTAGLGSPASATTTAAPTSTRQYIVTVTDANGCVGKDTVVVAIRPAPVANAGANSALCGGGTVTLNGSASGGSSPYTYSWSPSAGLSDPMIASPTAMVGSTTDFVLTVTDANGCTGRDTVRVIVNQLPQAHAGPDVSLCRSSSVSIGQAATGGTSPYSYSWSPATGLTAPTSATTNASPASTTQYIVTVIDANGCVGKDTVVVTVNDNPTANAGPDVTICKGDIATIGQPTGGGTPPYTYSWSPTAGLSSSTVAQPTASPTTTTQYIVTVTDGNGCTGKDTVVVTVIPKPVPTITPPGPLSICSGNNVLLTANSGSGITYQWSLNGNPIPGATSQQYTATQAGTYRVVETSSGCMDSSAAVLLTVNPKPVVDAGPDTSICPGTTVSIGQTAGGGTAPYTYSWSPVTGLASPTSAVTNASPLTTTQYVVTVTDANGCIGRDTVRVTVRPAPIANAGTNASLCGAGTVTLNGSASGGSSPYTYSWTPTTGLSDPATASPTATVSTTTDFILTVTDANGCTGRDTVRVTINQLPQAHAGPDVSICRSSSVSIGQAATGGTSPYTYSWSPVSGLSAPTSATTVAAPVNTTQYVVTVIDANGCIGKDTVVVMVNDNPSAHGGPDAVICQGDSVSIGQTATGGAPPYTYSWSPASGLTSSASATTSAHPSSTTQYVVTVTDANGCTGKDTVVITVIPKPVASITPPGPVSFCVGGNILLTANAGSGIAYQWSLNGNPIPGAVSRQYTATVAGSYRVAETSSGCADSSASVLATINPKPTAYAGADTSICPGASVPIGQPATGGTAPYTYSWSPATGLSSPTSATTSAIPTATTQYVVTVTDGNGCTGKDTVVVTVRPAPTAHAGNNIVQCGAGTVTLTGSATGGTAPYTYSWSPQTGLSNPSIDSPTATVTATIDYVLTVVDANGCEGRDTVRVVVNPPPTAHAGPDITICRGSSVSIGQPATGGTPPYVYSWSPVTGLSSPTSASTTATPTTSMQYVVTVVDANGCIGKDTVEITVTINPSAHAGPDVTICQGENVQIGQTATGGTAPYTYQWSPSSGLSSSTVPQPNASPSVSTQYIVTVTDANGCTGRDTVIVTVKPKPTAAITPPGPVFFCAGGSVLLSANVGSGLTYQWSFNGNPIPGATAQQYLATQAGVYRVIEFQSGCADSSAAVVVTVNPKPTAYAGADTAVCPGTTVPIGRPATGGAAPYAYYWSPAAGLSSRTVASPNATPSVTTQYIVTVTDANGCIGRDTVMVTVKAAPSAAFTGRQSVCPNTVADYTAQMNSNTRYTWTVTGGTIISGTGTYTISVRWGAGGTGSVELHVVNSTTGCFADSIIIVTINNELDPSITPSSPVVICNGNKVRLDAGAGYASYQWNTSETTQTIDVTKAGMYIVTVTDGSGCSGNDTVIVIARTIPMPVIMVSPRTEICTGDTVQLSVTQKYASYQWSNGADTRTIVVQDSGYYWVTVTDSIGCSSTSTRVHIATVDPPDPDIDGPLYVCINNKTPYTTTSRKGYKYVWSLSGGAIAQGQGTNSIVVQWTAPGLQFLEVVDTDSIAGCIGTRRIDVVVGDGYHPVLLAADSTLCEGDTTVLSTSSKYQNYVWRKNGVVIAGEIRSVLRVSTPGVYTLDVSDSTCSGSSNPVTITVTARPLPSIVESGPLCKGGIIQLTTSQPFDRYLWSTGEIQSTISVMRPGQYSVRVWNASGCDASASIRIAMDSIPPLINSGWPTSVCLNSQETYSVYDSANYTYTWQVLGGSITSGQNTHSIRVTWTTPGVGSISLTVRSGGGCEDSLHFPVSIGANLNPPLYVDGVRIPRDSILHVCRGTTLSLSTDKGYSTYAWTTGADTDTISVTATNNAGTYSVTVTDAGNCKGTSCKLTVIGDPVPAPLIKISGDTVLCPGDTVQLALESQYTSYLWSNGSISPSITVDSAGYYNVQVWDANGCTGTSPAVHIASRSLATPSIKGDAVLCAQSLRMYSIAQSPGASYFWTVSGGTIESGNGTPAVTVRWGTAGTGHVAVTVSDGKCSAGEMLDVTIGDKLRVSLNAPCTVLCPNDSVIICAPVGYASYNWSTSERSWCIVARSPGLYRVAVRDSAGCEGTSDTIMVRSDAAVTPLIVADGPVRFCLGDSVHLSTQIPYSAYMWSTGDTTSVITAGKPGSYYVTVRDSAGCEVVSAPIRIDVNASVNPDISGPSRVCINDVGTYSTDDAQGLTFTWCLIPPDSIGVIQSGQGTPAIQVQWHELGSTTIRLVVRDTATGCSGTTDYSVNVNSNVVPIISIDAPGSATLCVGSTTTIRTSKGYARYEWKKDGVVAGSADSLTVNDGGSFTVTVWTQSGCSGTSDATVISVHQKPNPTISSPDPSSFCTGDSARLTTAPGYASYQWERDGAAIPGATASVVTVFQSGSYTVSVMDSSGCFGKSAVFMVTVYPLPVPVITPLGHALLSTSAVSYQWYRNDTLIAGAMEQSLQAGIEGWYKVCVIDEHGCAGCSVPVRVDIPRSETTVLLGCPADTLFRAGKRIQYSIILASSDNLADTTKEYTAWIRFDHIVLAPLFAFDTAAYEGRDIIARIHGTRDASTTNGVLSTLDFIILLSDTTCSHIRMSSFQWSDIQTAVTVIDTSCVACVQICREGGERLLDMDGRVSLMQNRPNPFNIETRIVYEIIERGHTQLSVYDTYGRKVAVLVDGEIQPGRYAVMFNAGALSSGLYFYVLETPRIMKIRTMMLAK